MCKDSFTVPLKRRGEEPCSPAGERAGVAYISVLPFKAYSGARVCVCVCVCV